jgi:sporulation protein YlmC with PRC-barrel domain
VYIDLAEPYCVSFSPFFLIGPKNDMKRQWILFIAILFLTLFLAACSGNTGNQAGQGNPQGGFGQPGAAGEAANDGLIPETGGENLGRANPNARPDLDENDSRGNDDRYDDDQDRADRDDDRERDERDDDRDDDDSDDFRLGANLLPLSALDDARVFNRGGQPIGRIGGVIMDEGSGQVPFLIFHPDDDKRELKDQPVAIPLSAFGTEDAIRSDRKEDGERNDGRAVLVFDLDESVLKDAPAFRTDDDLTGEIDELRAYWEDETDVIPVTGQDSRLYRRLDGDFEPIQVYNRDGQQIGEIHELVLERESGGTRYYLLELEDADDDGFLLVEPDQFSRFGLEANERGLVLEADAETLDRAPRVSDREDLFRFDR